LAIEEGRIGVVAAELMEEISREHAEHKTARIRVVGLIVAVEYDEDGESHTKTHYAFREAPSWEHCARFVAVGLLNQVAEGIPT
jgi:adenosylmethionine-8-amino-7-oxononanoate aminotransferase